MPQTKLPHDGTHNLQDRYADTITKLKRKANVVRNFFNTDYMGDPKAGSVKIAKRPTEVAVGDYNVKTGATMTFGTTDYIPTLVDIDKAVNELIDGYEAAAVPDNVVAQRLESGAYSLGRTQELSAIKMLESDGTVESSTVASAAGTIYSNIVTSISNIKKLGVPKEDLVIIITDETEVLLLTDTKYSNTSATIGAELAREGIVSKIAGVPVVVSSNCSSGVEYIIFGRSWAGKVEDWVIAPAINDLKDGSHIGASALQGRMIYKDVLTDSTTCRIKRALAAGDKLDDLISGHSITSLELATRTITMIDVYPETIDSALNGMKIDGYITTDKVWPNGTYASAVSWEVDSGGATSLTATNLHLGGKTSVYLSELVTAGFRNNVEDHANKTITIVVVLKTPQAIDLTATAQVVISGDDFATQYVLTEESVKLEIDAE